MKHFFIVILLFFFIAPSSDGQIIDSTKWVEHVAKGELRLTTAFHFFDINGHLYFRDSDHGEHHFDCPHRHCMARREAQYIRDTLFIRNTVLGRSFVVKAPFEIKAKD